MKGDERDFAEEIPGNSHAETAPFPSQKKHYSPL
jgi:hypothetical protein